MQLSKIKYISSDIQIIILSKKSQFVHFLLKRKGGILHLNGHVTYYLPMTQKKYCHQNGIMGSQNPNLGLKKHIFRIAGTVFIADYFFWRPFWKYAN